METTHHRTLSHHRVWSNLFFLHVRTTPWMLGDGSCGLRSSAASGATLGERWSFSPTKSWERWTCWRPYRRQGGLDDPDAAITSVHERRKKEIQEQRNKPKEYPQQPKTKTVAKHAMSEVGLLPRPSYSRGRAYKAQSQHKHFMKNRFSKAFAILWPKFPKLVRMVFPKELLSASLFTSST